MQSAIQSTCCSIATIMLTSTDGLPGPVTMKRFGNPAVAMPEVGPGSVGPLVAQMQPVRADDAGPEQRAGHGVEPGGEDDDVEVVLGRLGPDPVSG